MKHVRLHEEQVPALGFGTWQIKGRECRNAVKDALETGYRHIDTAQAYQNEQHVGEGVAESGVPREDIWLTTKLWRNNLDRENLKMSVDESLEKLRTDYVDLLLIHWPFQEMNLENVLEEMNDLVESGKVKHIGVSNFTPEQVEQARRLSDEPIFTNQVEYHPFLNQDHLLKQAREEDMMMTAYSPLARGQVIGNPVLEEIGEKHGKSEAQVALRWLVQQENVAAIPKASSQEHREANFNISDFELSEEDMDRVHELTSENKREVNPGFAPDWS